MGTYISFLVRLWREKDPISEASALQWKAQVEHIQTGRRWTFDTLEETLAFLRRRVAAEDGFGSAEE